VDWCYTVCVWLCLAAPILQFGSLVWQVKRDTAAIAKQIPSAHNPLCMYMTACC
jgi:hypothetical protein